jgi:hypothetical protein
MARASIAAQIFKLSNGTTYYPVTPLSAGTANLTWTAADVTNDHVTPIVEGKTVVFARNVGATPHTVTITSVADATNRLGHITSYSITAGALATFGPFKKSGWDQASAAGLFFEADHVEIEFAVLQLP